MKFFNQAGVVIGSFRNWHWLGIFTLLILLLGIYFPSLSGGFLMDDDLHLTQDAYQVAPNALSLIWFQHQTESWGYWPLSRSFFWLQRQFWELNPPYYRLTNLLLHMANALLLYKILKSWPIKHSYWVVVLTAVHPLQVESVAWITQQKGLLALFFALGMFSFQQHYLIGGNKKFALMTLLFYAAALLCKSSVIGLPLVVLIWQYWRKIPWRWGQSVLLVAQMVIAASKVWTEIHPTFGHTENLNLSWTEHILLAHQTWLFYLFQWIFPFDLSFNYPRWTILDYSWLVLLPWSILGCSFLLFRKGKQEIFLGLMVYSLMLAPVLGFIGFGGMRLAWVSDHWSQSALIPLALLTVGAIMPLGGFITARSKAPLFIIPLLLASWWSWQSWLNSQDYQSAEKLYLATLQKNRDSWLASNNLGQLIMLKGEPEKALPYFEKALVLNAGYTDAWYNRGTAYMALKNYSQAIVDFNQALELNGRLQVAFNNRGIAYTHEMRYSEAALDFTKAIELQPDNPQPYINRGILSYRIFQQSGSACEDWQKACQLSHCKTFKDAQHKGICASP